MLKILHCYEANELYSQTADSNVDVQGLQDLLPAHDLFSVTTQRYANSSAHAQHVTFFREKQHIRMVANMMRKKLSMHSARTQ